MQKVAGVVIVFYPNTTALLSNIRSYINFTEILYVIDNTDDFQLQKTNQGKLTSFSEKIFYISNNGNKGIGLSLNKAALMAYQKGYKWLLTMDHDSWFSENELCKYEYEFKKRFFNDPTAAVVAPNYHKNYDERAKEEFEYVTAVITSGSLLQLDAWEAVEGFNDFLFIDEVDHDYCYRAVMNGYKIAKFKNIYIEHSIGRQKVAGYFGVIACKKRVIHSPFRLYFMVRNYLYVRKKYARLYPAEFQRRNKEVFDSVKNNLFFGGSFLKNLKSVFKGFADYRANKFNTNL